MNLNSANPDKSSYRFAGHSEMRSRSFTHQVRRNSYLVRGIELAAFHEAHAGSTVHHRLRRWWSISIARKQAQAVPRIGVRATNSATSSQIN